MANQVAYIQHTRPKYGRLKEFARGRKWPEGREAYKGAINNQHVLLSNLVERRTIRDRRLTEHPQHTKEPLRTYPMQG